MLRSATGIFGVALLLLGSGQVSTTTNPDTAGIRILELACNTAPAEGGSLRCVVEVDRLRDDMGMVAVAWGIDGAFRATDAATGSVSSWVVEDPPSGNHVVHVAVIDPLTGSTVEATTDFEIQSGGAWWLLWLVPFVALVGVAALGLWFLRRRRVQGTRSPTCATCSFALAAGDRFCPVCGAAVSARGGSFCPGCGSSVDASDRFCPTCGVVSNTG